MGNIATYQVTNRFDPSQIVHLTRKELIEKFNPDGFFFTTCWPGEISYLSNEDGFFEVYNMTPRPKREHRREIDWIKVAFAGSIAVHFIFIALIFEKCLT